MTPSDIEIEVTFSQATHRVLVPATCWWLLPQHDPEAWVEPASPRPSDMPSELRDKAYTSTLTTTLRDGRVLTGDDARGWIERSQRRDRTSPHE